MASRPNPTLQTNISPTTEDPASSIASPARGREMRHNLLSKLRPPPLVHVWDFWHDRQDRKPVNNDGHPQPPASTPETKYEDRLVNLATIHDVKDFWSLFNNFDISNLPLRDSIHLFHLGVKPIWEDPRNIRGGCWTFRVPKALAPAFWREICLLAVGEQLQAAVESKRIVFRDDICGVSLSVRFTSILVMVWNRDADHEKGVQGILETIKREVPAELMPRENSIYYKRHSEHAGFKGAIEGKEDEKLEGN